MKKRRWRFVSRAGVDLGTYEGVSLADALDAMAQDAGYRDAAHAEDVAGPFMGTAITEIQRRCVTNVEKRERARERRLEKALRDIIRFHDKEASGVEEGFTCGCGTCKIAQEALGNGRE